VSWPTAPLGELGRVNTGSTPKTSDSNFWNGNVPFVTPSELGLSVPITSAKRYLSDSGAKISRVAPANAVLVCCIGSLGKTGIAGRAVVPNQQINWVEFDQSLILPRYGYYACNRLERQLEASSASTTLSIVNKSKFCELIIPVPPLDEQRRIAALLDRADELRRKRKRAFDLLDSLSQSIFLEMFGSLAQASSVSELLKGGLLLLHKDGNHGSNYPRADEFGDDGIPFLSAKSIDDEGVVDASQIQYLRTSKAESLKIGWIEAGDVLLAHNASVGKVALYQGEYARALIGTSLTCYRPNPERLSPQYLMSALRSQYFQSQLTKSMGQTTRNQVPITAQRDLKIPVPAIEQQREYSDVAASQAGQAVRLKKHMVSLESLFSSLQQRAFSGQL
jgi:type I restriction enzyme S subunit